ncbi:hypothetical protein EYF80_060360 [Liparis tanakae]|uniref:Uncharacterized protein n=1 Tax=Liparis tanakae TaxID=230148 RepID=A0A4Z2ELP7_9TELE|nr:hypothetical protein EYF80_060360 [Liparis tanakae]
MDRLSGEGSPEVTGGRRGSPGDGDGDGDTSLVLGHLYHFFFLINLFCVREVALLFLRRSSQSRVMMGSLNPAWPGGSWTRRPPPPPTREEEGSSVEPQRPLVDIQDSTPRICEGSVGPSSSSSSSSCVPCAMEWPAQRCLREAACPSALRSLLLASCLVRRGLCLVVTLSFIYLFIFMSQV